MHQAAFLIVYNMEGNIPINHNPGGHTQACIHRHFRSCAAWEAKLLTVHITGSGMSEHTGMHYVALLNVQIMGESISDHAQLMGSYSGLV
jgi:hypothetical protein